MRILCSSIVAVLCCTLVANAQWLKLYPVARSKDFGGESGDESIFVSGGISSGGFAINDHGQTIYMTGQAESRGRFTTYRIYLDGELVVDNLTSTHSGEVPSLGEINNNGTFNYTKDDAVYVREPDGTVTRTAEDDLHLTWSGNSTYVSPPQIDGNGKSYFLASTPDQVGQTPDFFVSSVANLYSGTDLNDDFVVGGIALVEFATIPSSFVSWDVNDNGDVAIGGGVVLAGQQLGNVDYLPHTSINNHGEFSRIVQRRTGEGRFVWGIEVVDAEGAELFLTDDQMQSAFINDQRNVLFKDRKTLHLLETETGEITTLIDLEDGFSSFTLFNYNDAGQMAINLRTDDSLTNLFIGTPSNSPIPDLNLDSETTGADIDGLAAAIREGSTRPRYDLNQDGQVSSDDFDFWVAELVGTTSGDADLDLDVDFQDFLMLSAEFGNETGWAGGDFDGSGQTEFDDFLLLSSNFGTTGEMLEFVPEPSLNLVSALCFLVIFGWSRSAQNVTVTKGS